MMKLFMIELLVATWTFPCHIQGGLIFSQSQVELCPTDRLVLTCSSNNVAFLQWKVSNPQQIILSSVTRTVSNEGTTPPLTFGDTTFQFSLTSTPETLPHTSQISADNVVNGTVVSCSEWINQRAINTQSATICIIGNNCGPVIVAPVLNVTERFEPTGVVAVVEWITENRVSYNFSVFPEVVTTFIGESTVQLIIPYNIQLTVNVSATLCGQERTAVEIIYHVDDSIPQYPSSDINPASEGTAITFTCSASDLVLTGPNSTICMSNGEWEPDPAEVSCKVDCGIPSTTGDTTIYYISTLEGSELVYSIKCEDKNVTSVAVCQKNATWLPDPSADSPCSPSSTMSPKYVDHSELLLSTDVIIAVVSSTSIFVLCSITIIILIFICGFLCGRHFSKKPTTSQSREEGITEDIQLDPSSPSGPVYENIASEAIEHCDNDETNVDLNTNVSYGPLSIFTK